MYFATSQFVSRIVVLNRRPIITLTSYFVVFCALTLLAGCASLDRWLYEKIYGPPYPDFRASLPDLGIVIDDSWSISDNQEQRLLEMLRETAYYLYRHFDDEPEFPVSVGYDSSNTPLAYYRTWGSRVNKITLNTSPKLYRPQLMYQFAHEYCHIISDITRVRPTSSRNGWFHETLCELASIYVLYGTREPKLKSYIDRYRKPAIERLASITNFKSWFKREEGYLRQLPLGQYDRSINATIAFHLLPIFQRYPKLWSILRYLPKSNVELDEYLIEWKKKVDTNERYLITELQKVFF